jgi:signal transduction histidine kinase
MVEAVAATSSTRFEAALSPVDGLFSPDAEGIIVRMLEECLRNVVQHAQATESSLTIERQPASVIMTVWDNGQGFDAHASKRARRAAFGLDGLAQQVRSLGGALSIASASGEGTTITIILDVPETRAEG